LQTLAGNGYTVVSFICGKFLTGRAGFCREEIQ